MSRTAGDATGREDWERLVQAVNSIILRIDAEGHILFVNEFGLRFFGFPDGELEGKNVLGTIVPLTDTAGEDLAGLIKDILQAPDNYVTNENENRRYNDDRVWIAWTNRAIRDQSGTVKEILCVGNDITDRKQAERDFKTQTERLRERVKELDCLYSISKVLDQYKQSLAAALEEIVKLVPRAWQFAESACARIVMEGQTFTTDNFKDTPWKQESPICIHGSEIGSLAVCYLSEQPLYDEGPFLKEERNLINEITAQLGRALERASTIEALRASETKHKTLIDNVPQKIFFKNVTSTYVSCNDNYARDLGIRSEEIAGKTDFDFYDADLAEKYRADDRRIMESGVMEELEERYVVNGRERYVNTVKTPVKDGSGAVVGVLGTFWDISERKEMEREKERIDGQLKRTIANLSIKNEISEILLSTRSLDDILHMILIGATAYQGLGFNRAFLLLLDDTESALEGKFATGPLDAKTAYQTWGELARRNHTITELFNLGDEKIPKEDEPINRLVSQMNIPLNNPKSMFYKVVQEQRSFNVVDGFSNPALETDFLYLLGTDCFALVPLVSRGQVQGVLLADNFINQKEITDTDVRLLRDFANHASLAIENAHLYARLQEKVDELSSAYNELKVNRDKLLRYERLSAVGEMAAQIVHDIRNPMTAIGGFARRLLKKGDDVESNKTYLEIIIREIDRLERILGNLLTFTRPVTPTFEAADINSILSSICEFLGLEMLQQSVELEERLDPDVPRFPFDEDQIRRVLSNLIRNAIEAMETGGTLTVSTALIDEKVQIDVADTGPGIAEHEKERVFEPFYTSKTTGSGLGLSLADQIVKAHGGALKIYDRQPLGAIVSLLLPLEPKEED